jgi:hypothetical protein
VAVRATASSSFVYFPTVSADLVTEVMEGKACALTTNNPTKIAQQQTLRNLTSFPIRTPPFNKDKILALKWHVFKKN